MAPGQCLITCRRRPAPSGPALASPGCANASDAAPGPAPNYPVQAARCSIFLRAPSTARQRIRAARPVVRGDCASGLRRVGALQPHNSPSRAGAASCCGSRTGQPICERPQQHASSGETCLAAFETPSCPRCTASAVPSLPTSVCLSVCLALPGHGKTSPCLRRTLAPRRQ